MSKRARHQPGFYATLLNNVCDRASNSKYRPKVKPTVTGVSEVERVVEKRVKGRNIEYFIHQQNYSPSENTWEPAEHLPEDLIAAFENRSVDPLRADECKERLSLLFDSVNLLTLRNCSKNVEDIVSFGFLFLCDNTKSFVLLCLTSVTPKLALHHTMMLQFSFSVSARFASIYFLGAFFRFLLWATGAQAIYFFQNNYSYEEYYRTIQKFHR